MGESCLNWADDAEFAFCSTDDRSIQSKLLKMCTQWPEEVKIIRLPAENDGCLYIRIPIRFARRCLKMLIPGQREPMSDERKAAAAERMKAYHAHKRMGGENDDKLK